MHQARLTVLLKCLAMVFVFSISMAIPLLIYGQLKKSADSLLIQKDLEQIQEWAIVYKLKNGSYDGLEKNVEIIKKKIDITVLGGKPRIFVSSDKDAFCVASPLLDAKTKWCVDGEGYSGKEADNCRGGGLSRCQ